MNGIIPLYKPRGLTSFQCIRKLRHILGVKKMGHSGTLDPDVDGVLPICVGKATKVASKLMQFGKVYQGTITLGFSTTTEDLSGKLIKKSLLGGPFPDDQINNAMQQLVNPKLIQIPPMYSAVRVNGHHLYEYARKGLTVKRPRRTVRVDYFKSLRPSYYDSKRHLQIIYFEIGCGKGTYIRTMATMLGRILKIPAVMSNLTRTRSGDFTLKQTMSFKYIKDHSVDKIMYPISHALKSVPQVKLSSSQWKRVQNGAFLYSEEFNRKFNKMLLIYEKHTKALYKWDEHRHCYCPEIMFSTK